MQHELSSTLMPWAKVKRLLVMTALIGVAAESRAQHVDILVQSVDGKLTTGSADFASGSWSLGRRVYAGEFDADYSVNDPGFNALTASSPALPEGSAALPADTPLSWDFLSMLVDEQHGNLFYWDGSEADGMPGLTPNDVDFGLLPGVYYTLGLYDQSATRFAIDGADAIVAGGEIGSTGANGALHLHRYFHLDDGDNESATQPADGIYLFALQLNMAGLESSWPLFMVFGTPGSSVAALGDAALPWVEARVDELVPNRLQGDYNEDGVVDAADYTVWRDALGSVVAHVGDGADGDLSGEIDEGDHGVWKQNFGRERTDIVRAATATVAVPEPCGLSLATVAMAIAVFTGWRRSAFTHAENGAAADRPRGRRLPRAKCG